MEDSTPVQQPQSQEDIVLSPELAQYTAPQPVETPSAALPPEPAAAVKPEEHTQPKTEKAVKRARSAGRLSAKQHAEEEDTESEDGQSKQQKQLKRRRTIAGGSSPQLSAEHEAKYLSLDDMPEGWTRPLLYFIQASAPPDAKVGDKAKRTHKSADSNKSSFWAYLPLRRVCNGCAWLTEVCSGTPGINEHADGPTAILRDLCAIVQAGHSPEELDLHPKGVATLNLANSRQEFEKSKNTSIKFALPTLVRVANEKEYLHFIPLDLIAHCLTQQLRAMCKKSNSFPSQLFAPELHICQYAPVIALHLGASGMSKKLDALLARFGGQKGRELLEQLEKLFNENVTLKAGMSRKRRGMDAGAQRLQTFAMTTADTEALVQLCEQVEQGLERLKPVRNPPSHSPPPKKAYQEGDFVIKDLRAVLIDRFAAALRHQIYDAYDISPQIITFADAETNEDAQLNPTPHSVHSRFLDSEPVSFIDFTLNDSQEKWLMDLSARNASQKLPDSEFDREFMHFLISNTSNEPNVKLVVKPAAHVNKSEAVNELLVSLQATREISSNESVTLPVSDKKATWAEIAADSSQNDAETKTATSV